MNRCTAIMLFQKKKCYRHFAGSVYCLGRAIRVGYTNSYNFRPYERVLDSRSLLSSLPFTPSHFFLFLRYTGDSHFVHVDDHLRGYTRASPASVQCTRACNVRMKHAVDATNPMHFNIGCFNDLHNEAICFLSSRMRPRRLSRNRIRKYT